MTDHWFRPKTHGYGATPANWKGWAAVGCFFLIGLALSLVLIVLPSESGSGPGAMQIGLFLALIIALTASFIRFCRQRTDGAWRWRWGEGQGREGGS